MNTILCPHCHQPHAAGARICPATGRSLAPPTSSSRWPLAVFASLGLIGLALIAAGMWAVYTEVYPAPTVRRAFSAVSTPTTLPDPTPTAIPLTSTLVPTATSTPTQIPTLTPTARLDSIIYGFLVCVEPCLADGSNATRTFPGGITEIYAWWNYENIPVGAHYVRAWTMDGREWVRYDCIWPGPETGADEITLSEPGGLHSGTWEVTITVNNSVLLREQLVVEGTWDYWFPAGTFNTCYGKK